MGSQQCWNCLMMRSLPGLLVLTAFCAFYQSVKILPHRWFYLHFSVEPKYSSMLLLLVAACCGVLLWGWLGPPLCAVLGRAGAGRAAQGSGHCSCGHRWERASFHLPPPLSPVCTQLLWCVLLSQVPVWGWVAP